MENIRDHYTIPLEQTPILENMDNCIDEEGYHKIEFKVGKNALYIEMVGSGMDPHTFLNVLPTLAATTKGVKPGLGHYGWGMKVGMCVSDQMMVENKREDFHAAQRWRLKGGVPMRKVMPPTREFAHDTVAINHELNEEYSKKITPSFVRKTLQEFYPTMLDGVPVLGRKIKVTVNSEPVPAPEKPEYEHKQAIWTDVDGERATGKVFIANDTLPENQRGIAIIVCGRKIMRDNFGIYSKADDRLTGYLHADMLYTAVKTDKTQISRSSSSWDKLSKGICKQLGEFMRKVGILEEKGLDRKDMAFVNKELAKILVDFHVLNPYKFEVRKDVLIEKASGETLVILGEGSQPVRGTEEGPGRPSDIPTAPGEEPREGPVKGTGKKRGTTKKRKAKSGPEIGEVNSPEVKKEAWFSEGEGKVWINNAKSSFKKAERWGRKAKRYHVLRCSLDALLEWALRNERINLDKYLDMRTELFLKWGGLRGS